MKHLARWLIIGLSCVAVALVLCWSVGIPGAATASDASPKTESTKPESTKPAKEEALTRFRQRVNLVLAFQSEGFERKGMPGSQLATIPPVWTGEKLRGEKDETPLSRGAVILFTSPTDGTLIVVDIAYVEGLSGHGIMRTAWIDNEVTAKAGTCMTCSGHGVIQFYEPGFVYTLTAMRPDGKPGSLYRFAGDLMQRLRENPFSE